METMTPAIAVKKFFEKDSCQPPISTGEFMAFWKSCSPTDKEQFALTAAEELGITLKKSA
jgi:hypothetical protein